MFHILNKPFSFYFSKVVYQNIYTANVVNSLPLIEPVALSYNMYSDTGIDYGAPPLIIMHGLFGSKKNWHSFSKKLQSKLNPRRKIITVDARNHGDSPHSPYHTYAHLAEDVNELLKQLNIDRASVMGHSMGGRTMMYLALKYPNLVDRVISIDASPINNPAFFGSFDFILHLMKSTQLSPQLSQAEGRKKVAEEFQKTISNPRLVEFFLHSLKKLDNGNFAWKLNLTALESNIDNMLRFPENILNVNQYRGPVHIIGGTKSDYVNSSDLASLKKPFPNTTLNWIDSGHLIHFERPDELLSLIINFLNLN